MKLLTQANQKINKYSVGCFLAYAYIFTSYVAHDILISARLNSLCLYAFLLCSAYIFFTNMKVGLKNMGFMVWYIVFAAVSVMLMLLSPSFSGVFHSFYVIFVSMLVALCLQIHVGTDRGFRNICWCYAISSVALVLLLFFTGNLSGTADNRLGQDTLGNANIFATIMMMGVMFAIWLLVYDCPKKLQKIGLAAIIILELYSLVLSGGRKYFLVPFIFFYVLLLNKQDKKGRKHTLLYTAVFVVLMLVVWNLIMNVPIFYDAIGVRMEGLVANLQGEVGDDSSEIRETIRTLAFSKWFESPLIGYGFDSFKYLALEEVGHFFYSHCNYTELLYSGGIFYLLLYYWIYFRILRNCFVNKQTPVCYRAFAMGAVISFFIFDYGAVTYNSTPQISFMMMAYMASIFQKESNVEKEI